MNAHEGHRARLRSKYLMMGMDAFEPHEVLEMLLFQVIPRRDVNEVAHALMRRFGSFANVLFASEQELRQVPGVGAKTAAFLALLPIVFRYFHVSMRDEGVALHSTQAAAEYLMPRFQAARVETVMLLVLSAKGGVLHEERLASGTVSAAAVRVRMVVDAVLMYPRGAGVVLAHNHPSGIALPSPDDLNFTRRLETSLRELEIRLLDHIIVAGDDYVSLRESGVLKEGGPWRT
jgi:DNA repair protein RadC